MKKETVATGETVDGLGPTRLRRGWKDARHRRAQGSASTRNASTYRYGKATPFDSMIAYSGTYTLDDEKVIHHVDVSWRWAFQRLSLIRFYKLANGILTITAAPAIDPHSGKEVIHRLEFRKA